MALAERDLLDLVHLIDEDEPAVLEAVFNYLAVLDAEEDGFEENAQWVKIFVDVDGWRRLGDPTFQRHFRMPKHVFEELVNAMGQHLRAMGRLQRNRTPLDVILMMALWILFTPDTFRSTAIKFHGSPGVVFYHYAYIIEALREMGPLYVHWPSPEERVTIKRRFLERSGYPGVVGCIDGTHTYITAPYVDQQAFVNRHHTHSILTQAVVDHTLLIRDLYVGEAGSLHDSRVFRRSPLSRNLLENRGLLNADEHILGDGAYILNDKVLIPYTNNGVLTDAQRLHNNVLSRCRSTVERSFGLCKGRFRRLKQMESHNINIAVDHITACFVLHNFIILSGEVIAPQVRRRNIINAANEGEDRVHGDDDADNFPNVAVEPDHHLLAEARIAGEEKRGEIAGNLYLARVRN